MYMQELLKIANVKQLQMDVILPVSSFKVLVFPRSSLPSICFSYLQVLQAHHGSHFALEARTLCQRRSLNVAF